MYFGATDLVKSQAYNLAHPKAGKYSNCYHPSLLQYLPLVTSKYFHRYQDEAPNVKEGKQRHKAVIFPKGVPQAVKSGEEGSHQMLQHVQPRQGWLC